MSRHHHHCRILRLLLLLLFPAILFSCSSGSSNPPPDTTPPSVTILSPSTGATFYTATTPQFIGGFASDNKGVSRVTWSSDQGYSGTATGAATWSADIPLIAGDNVVTVRAVDAAGNSRTDTITLHFTTNTRTLSGTVSAPSYAQVDSDVNDPNASYAYNGSTATAQSIPNPTLLGGHVNQPLAGDDGQTYSSGDMNDYFSVSLSAGNTVTLYIGDNTTAHLDLYLYDSSPALAASDLSAQATKSVTAATTGDYYIRVNALSGASNYTLAVGQPGTSTAMAGAQALNVAYDFALYEAIVRFAPSQTTSAAALAAGVGMTAVAGAPDREMRLRLAPGTQRQQAQAAIAATVPAADDAGPALDEETQARLDTLLWIARLRERPDVISASPNYKVRTFAAPSDTFYAKQWHYPAINLPQAWDITTGDRVPDVIVAVVDTGVLLSHPDLAGQLVSGYDFISDTAVSLDGDGIDPDPDDPGDQGSGSSSSFHGTHVAGTIAAASNNATGVAGIAWQAKIMPVRALGKGGGYVYDILQAVRYAAGIANDSGAVPSRKADVINLSIGGPGYDAAAQDIYNQVRAAGVIVVAAAGNDNTSTPSYPAAYDNVVSVSAVDINLEKAYYSNFGSTIDVAAPGGDVRFDLNGDSSPDGVLSTCGNDSSGTIQFVYRWYQGTSMASPHVAGVAALMKAVNAGMTPADFDTFLITGAIVQDLGAAGRDDIYGNGLIDALLAVQAAQTGPPTAAMTVQPSSLNFGPVDVTATLTASQLGGTPGDLTVDSVTDDASWLTVTADTVDANGFGTYTVTVDRSHGDLSADGNYAATVTLVSSAPNTVNIPVNVQVNSAGLPADAGFHYVLLLTEDSLDTVAEYDVASLNGDYSYTFTNVPEGVYRIVAGSDYDNDFMVGDAGESYGIYSSLENPTELVVDGNKTGLDFVTEMTFSVTTASTQGTPLARLPIRRRPSAHTHREVK